MAGKAEDAKGRGRRPGFQNGEGTYPQITQIAQIGGGRVSALKRIDIGVSLYRMGRDVGASGLGSGL